MTAPLVRLASVLVLVFGLFLVLSLDALRAEGLPDRPPPAAVPGGALKALLEQQAASDPKAETLVKETIRQADWMAKAEALALLKLVRDRMDRNAAISERTRAVLRLRLQRLQQRIEHVGSRRELEEKLAKPFDFLGYDDPITSLGDAIVDLQKQHGVVITINDRAFRNDQVQDVLKTEIARTALSPGPIPPMARTTLSAVLKKLLSRVPAPSGAVFHVRDGAIEITTGEGLVQAKAAAEPRVEKLPPVLERQAANDREAETLVTETLTQADWMPKPKALGLLKQVRDGLERNTAISEHARVVQRLRVQRLMQRIENVGSRRELEEKLAKRFDFPGYDDPKAILADALESFRKEHGVVVTVNERAFLFDQVQDVLKTEIAQPNAIPPMARTMLNAVLKKLLERVPAPSGAFFHVHDGAIEITTGQALASAKVPANTPAEKLLPVPPKPVSTVGPLLGDDLTQVPEVALQEPLAATTSPEAILKQVRRQVAHIISLNDRKRDGFHQALLPRRPDLAGLPFVLGKDCRISPEQSGVFAAEVSRARPVNAANYWEQYRASCKEPVVPVNDPTEEHVLPARVAALMQILAPEEGPALKGLPQYLGSLAHPGATRALARLVLFAPEEEVRRAAIEALQHLREREYTDILLSGLRYPWPVVARRASEALVKLGRTDLVPKLVEVLEQPDPRLPVVQEVEGKRVPVLRELVRINHLRNCLLCHPPIHDPISRLDNSPSIVRGAMPLPGQPLPSPLNGYGDTPAELSVRVDVTYLRQEFSLMQRVAEAAPWPEMQRFDFVVRMRTLTEEEAQSYRDKLQPREPGVLSPYHRPALAALRELTGKDTEPTAPAWRKLLSRDLSR